jgi:hypothetical protein
MHGFIRDFLLLMPRTGSRRFVSTVSLQIGWVRLEHKIRELKRSPNIIFQALALEPRCSLDITGITRGGAPLLWQHPSSPPRDELMTFVVQIARRTDRFSSMS